MLPFTDVAASAIVQSLNLRESTAGRFPDIPTPPASQTWSTITTVACIVFDTAGPRRRRALSTAAVLEDSRAAQAPVAELAGSEGPSNTGAAPESDDQTASSKTLSSDTLAVHATPSLRSTAAVGSATEAGVRLALLINDRFRDTLTKTHVENGTAGEVARSVFDAEAVSVTLDDPCTDATWDTEGFCVPDERFIEDADAA